MEPGINIRINPNYLVSIIREEKRNPKNPQTENYEHDEIFSSEEPPLLQNEFDGVLNFDGSAERFSKQPSHAEILLDYYDSMYRLGKFVDVMIKCDGVLVIKAHRVVLASFSSTFEELLMRVDGRSVVNLDIDSKITGVIATDLKEIINYMYTGRLMINHISILSSLKELGISLEIPQELEHVKNLNFGNEIFLEDPEHAEKLLASLDKFRVFQKFFDCCLKIQDKPVVHAHRVLLSAFSQNLEEGLRESAPTKIVSLELNNMAPSASQTSIRMLVDFMYTGRIRITPKLYSSLRNVALSLGVVRLADLLNEELYNTQQEKQINRESVNFDQQGQNFEQILEDSDIQNDSSAPLLASAKDYQQIYKEFVKGPPKGCRRLGSAKKKPEAQIFKEPPTRTILMDSETGEMYYDESHPSTSDGNYEIMDHGDQQRVTVEDYGFAINGIHPVQSSMPVVGNQRLYLEKPYKCSLCNHRTKEKSALEKHIRCIHTGEAPYRCIYCPQAFKIQSNLVRHLRAHTGEKPYVCKKCGTPYADKKNMDAHIFRDHLKMRQFQCQEPSCTAKFWRQDRYALHCEKIHGFTPILSD